jgi:mono/diheme cytochrome c family protein
MPKFAAGLLVLAVVALFTSIGAQQGCRDATQSAIHWGYFSKRDMRRTVALMPQKTMMMAPDTGSVPVSGREIFFDRDVDAGRFTNPQAPDDSSLARGQRKFMKTCVPCHGPAMASNGPVAPQFMPPPDLLAEMSRQRSDGFIYSYIRTGGVVMPSYGAQVTAREAYDLINYIRHMQKVSPR